MASMKREQPGWAVVLACLAFFSLLPGALADLGPKPTAEAMLSVDGKPFQNALVSLQECVETAGGPNEDYSLGGLGAAQAWVSGNGVQALLRDEEGTEAVAPLQGRQLEKARAFVRPAWDAEKKCYWQPAYRAFAACEKAACTFTYMVPQAFRLTVLDLDSGAVFTSRELKRTGFNAVYEIGFDSGTGQGKAIETSLTGDWQLSLFVALLLATLVIELFVGALAAHFWLKRPARTFFVPVAIGNLASYPLVFFGLRALPAGFAEGLLLLELGAFALEAMVLKKMTGLTWKQALACSAGMNLASFAVGGLPLAFT
ncbi:MAG TPA: hypothetical protein HA252_01535 [Candidatus Diapherotrites archaeon]|uniref:Uncharacterized protein n=2 Tax=Candidatus Iainarchaeum sp. TaxID=3101447 RepID=A0A7J4JLD6_9ARCH|nr:hypothetical protein [Candidatus Diapherotrites archaeon]